MQSKMVSKECFESTRIARFAFAAWRKRLGLVCQKEDDNPGRILCVRGVMLSILTLCFASLTIGMGLELSAHEWNIVGVNNRQFYSVSSDGSRAPRKLDRELRSLKLKQYGQPVEVINGPVTSPDGKWDAYVTKTWVMAANNSRIAVVEKSSGEATFVRSGSYWDEHPCWLPDNKSLLFCGGNAGTGDHRLMSCEVVNNRKLAVISEGKGEVGDAGPITTRDGKILFPRRFQHGQSEKSEWAGEIVALEHGAEKMLLQTDVIVDWGLDASESCLAVATTKQLSVYSWPGLKLMESWMPSELDYRWNGAFVEVLKWRPDDKAMVVSLNGSRLGAADELQSHWVVLDWDSVNKDLKGRKLLVPRNCDLVGWEER